MEIRIATIKDALAIQKIYEPYVLNTAVSFEYEVPSVLEFENRIKNTLIEYPYLVAIEDEHIVGYAYASCFHPREAYKHDAELSIYIDENHRKKGFGRQLYQKLQELLLRQNIYAVHACIATLEQSDEYLTKDSELFHEKLGFKVAGKHELCGYKFGKWYSMIWMDKVICKRPENVEAFIPFSQIN